MEADAESMIGSRVGIKTSLGDTLEGVVFTYDTAASALVLEQRAKSTDSQATYRILKTSAVREITVISHPEPKPNDEKRPLPEIDMAAVKTREERAVARAQEEAAQINTAVTVRAQAIFDALRKTMPCEWRVREDEAAILVLNEVLVREPFTPESCVGEPGTALARVKRVLGGELKKLESVLAAAAPS